MIDIVQRGRVLDLTYTGSFNPDEFNQQMDRSAASSAVRGTSLVLIDLTHLADFQPTTAQRHAIGSRAAKLGQGLRRVAVVVTEQQLDPDLFTITVARNRGLPLEVFTDRDEALDWLRRAA